MIEDIVINSYKQQIKESRLKAQAVKIAGFDIIIDELKKRSINTDKITDFFNKINDSKTKEELNSITVDELDSITSEINMDITRSLISSVELADTLLRKSRIIAKEQSPNGKVLDSDNYVKVGANLSSEINKHGIASGISTCIKNYCIQKLYQLNYQEKIIEKEKELGTYVEEEQTRTIHKKTDSKKELTLKEILKDNNDEEYKLLVSDFYDFPSEEKKREVNKLFFEIESLIPKKETDNTIYMNKLTNYNEENIDSEDQNLTKIYNDLIIIKEKLNKYFTN